MHDAANKTGADPRCVWMSAGIINYKLCDRDFQCEDCEFNKAMQGMLPQSRIENPTFDKHRTKRNDATSLLINRYLYSLFFDCTIHLDRFYHPSHLWFMAESENVIKVGIDKTVIKIIEPVEKIILPQVGEIVSKNQLILWIVRNGKMLPLHSPLAGKIIERNDRLLHEGLKQVLDADDFCFKLQDDGIRDKIQQLCSSIPRLESFDENISIVKKHLEKAFHQNVPKEIGVTLADGGDFQTCIEKVVGENIFHEMLNELFSSIPSREADDNASLL